MSCVIVTTATSMVMVMVMVMLMPMVVVVVVLVIVLVIMTAAACMIMVVMAVIFFRFVIPATTIVIMIMTMRVIVAVYMACVTTGVFMSAMVVRPVVVRSVVVIVIAATTAVIVPLVSVRGRVCDWCGRHGGCRQFRDIEPERPDFLGNVLRRRLAADVARQSQGFGGEIDGDVGDSGHTAKGGLDLADAACTIHAADMEAKPLIVIWL